MDNKNCINLDNQYYNKDTCNQVANIVFSATKKPTIVNPNSNFVIVTYWWGRGNLNKNTAKPCPTEENPIVKPEDITRQPITYEAMIDNWEEACRKANCNYLAIEYPEFAVKGGYQLAINAKPLFIKRALELCDGRAVVYIDGDMVVHKYPSIFDIKDYDFMARHWNMDPRSTRHYNKLACFDLTSFETSGGIMYFNNTLNGNLLLNKWISYTFNKTQAGKADDRIISLIMTSNKKFLFNVKMIFLPLEFLWLTDKYVEYLNSNDYPKYLRSKGIKLPSNYTPENDIIIEHPECLTLEEIAADQGAAANRAPRLYEKLVGRNVACSKYGGYFWEYIFFENKEQLANFNPYMTYIKTVSIEDIYAEGDEDEEQIKPPYSVIKYDSKYGDRFNPIAEMNRKLYEEIKEILKSLSIKEDYINVIYEANPSGNSKKLHLEYDDDTSNIYCNYISPLIIALFSLNKRVVFIPKEDRKTKYHIKTINKELKANSELELIFSNKFNYLNIDKIELLKTPIFFKPTRVLNHLLRLVNPELPFFETFQKVFKSSQLFAFNIRIGSYKSFSSSSSSVSNPDKKEMEAKKQNKQLFNRLRFKLLKEKGERKEPKKESPKKESPKKESPKKEKPLNRKVCPEGQILNPDTNRCVSKTGKIGMAILLKQQQGINQEPKKSKLPVNSFEIIDGKPYKKCPEGQIRNPETKRCVSKTGAIGKKLLNQK